MGDTLTTAELEALEQAPSGASSSLGDTLTSAQLDALDRGIDPQFGDVTSRSSSAMTPPPLAQRFHDSLTFGSPEGYMGTFNPLDALSSTMGVLKAPVNAAYRFGARSIGLPVGDEATPEQGVGELVGGWTPNPDTIGGILSNAGAEVINPLTPLMHALGPRAEEVNKGLTEKASGMAFDPSSILLAGGALPSIAHGAMQTAMTGGITTQGLEAVDEYKKNGISGKFLSLLSGMGVDGLFMLSGHLSKGEMKDITESSEVKNTINPPPVEEIDPAQIKLIDKITKAQDTEEIAKQRAATKAGNLSDADYAKKVDQLSDTQNREEIANRREMSKPPIPLEPLFPEGEIPKDQVSLLDKLQSEQEKGENEERFAEARKQVKDLESGEEEEDVPLDELEKPSLKGSEMPVEEEGIKITPEIQDAVEGFSPKTSIKNLQDKLDLNEDDARDLYWKTKKAIFEERQGGNFPLESLEESPKNDRVMGKDEFYDDVMDPQEQAKRIEFQRRLSGESKIPTKSVDVNKRLTTDALNRIALEKKGKLPPPSANEMSHSMAPGYGEHISPETKNAAVNNPAYKRIMTWVEKAFPHAQDAARRAIYGEEDVEKSHFGGGHYDPRQLGSRLYGDSGSRSEGNIKVNPWTLAQVAAHAENTGAIPKGTAHQYFAEKLINNLLHENAHVGEAKGPHMSKMDPEGYFDPEGANREFAFETRHEAIKNDPQVQSLKRILDPKNDALLKSSFQGILKDANKMGGEAERGRALMQPPPARRKYSTPASPEALMASPNLPPSLRLGGPNVGNPSTQKAVGIVNPSLFDKIRNGIGNVVSMARSFTVGGDVSSPFRQSWIQTFAHPLEAAKNIAQMPQTLSEKGYERISSEIRQNPYFKEAVDAKLSLTKGLRENVPEEQFAGNELIHKGLEKVGLGKVDPFSSSERAYTQYLNKTRMDAFQRGMEVLEGKYGRRGVPDESKAALAKWVNTSTGRGSFRSAGWEAASGELNKVLFSPRLMKSRIDVFNPMEWKRMYETEPAVAKMAATDLAKSAALVGSMVAMAKAAGAKVEGDPRSPDFGKIRVGQSSIDPWGGYQQYIRYGAQLLSGQRKNAYGEIKNAPREDTAKQFIRSKLAPVPGFIWSAATGKNMIGRRTSLTNPASYVEAFAPMTLRDITEVAKQDPVLAVALTLPISLGMGTVTREPLNASKEVRGEYERLMVPPPADAQTIPLKGQPKVMNPLTGRSKVPTRDLTDKEYEDAKKEGDKMSFSRVEELIKSPEYKSLPDERKRIVLNNFSRKLGGQKRKLASQLMTPPPQ